jgi:hypothetical protein
MEQMHPKTFSQAIDFYDPASSQYMLLNVGLENIT